MSMHPLAVSPVPPETARIAHLAFPKGNRDLLLRDHLGRIYQDRHFAHLFAADGQPAIAPWRPQYGTKACKRMPEGGFMRITTFCTMNPHASDYSNAQNFAAPSR
jgi:hypothetical protein